MNTQRQTDSHCPLCGSKTTEILQGKMVVGDLVIDGLTVYRAGKLIKLQPNEMWLLVYLMKNAGRVVTRGMVEQHAWGFRNGDSLTNAVDVYISHLRKKIDRDFPSKMIHTMRGYGYMLSAGGPRTGMLIDNPEALHQAVSA
jgi:two-component system OmpR family response regulator